MAPDRRQGARHRCHERLAHAALRHPQGRLGRGSAATASVCPQRAAGSARLRGGLRHGHADDPRRSPADPRRRRRSAGRHHRPGLLFSRHDESHLRHRLLCSAQHRGSADRLQQQAAHHDRLSTRWPADLCARGCDFHRWCGRAMAARRPERHCLGLESGDLAAQSDPAQHVYLVPPSWGWGRPTGSRTPAALSSA